MMRSIATSIPILTCPKCKSTNIFELEEDGTDDFDAILYKLKRCRDCSLIISERWKLLDIKNMDLKNGIKKIALTV
jgi:hypothetical protein